MVCLLIWKDSFDFCLLKLCWCPHVETRSTAWKKHSFWYAHLLLRSRWYKKEANLLHVEFDSSGAIICPCDLRAISFKMLCTITNTVAPFGRSACIFCHEISYKPLMQIYGGSVCYLLPIDGHYCTYHSHSDCWHLRKILNICKLSGMTNFKVLWPKL